MPEKPPVSKERLKEEDFDEETKKKFEDIEPSEDESEEDEEDSKDGKKKKKSSKGHGRVDAGDNTDTASQPVTVPSGEASAQGISPTQTSEYQRQNPAYTTSPGLAVPSQPQNVFVPQSTIRGTREQTTPMSNVQKDTNTDLQKSPLFLNLSGQIDGIKDSLSKKLDSIEKSVNDRLTNVLKDMEKLEKFYNQSFYKMAGENVSPEGTEQLSIAKQLEMGAVRFRNK